MRSFGINRFQFGLLLCAFLVTQGAVAQVELGGLQFRNLQGSLGFGYDGQYGVQEQSNHDTGLNGNLTTSGFYYNPGFLAFQANTYYARGESSSESTSLSNSKGYTMGASIFGGSQDPGYVSFAQNWGQSSTYGLDALGAGLNSTTNNRDFSVSWLFRNLPVRNLAVYFTDNANNVDIPGIGVTNNSSTKGFGAATSGYNIAGFSLAGSYQHSLTDTTANFDGGTSTGSGSSDVFHAITSRALPWHSNLTFSAYRIMTRSSSEGDRSSGDSNEFDASINSHVWRLPLSGSISYNDNVYQSVLQQLNASGQVVYLSENTPKIGELNMNLFSSYTLPHQVFVTGFISHQEEFVAGQTASATGYGGTVGTGFGKFLKGLTVTIGMHDTATQVGNTGAGLVATASYRRNLGAWRFNANASYNQGIQTLLATTTESSMGANASVRRELLHRISFGASAGYGRSLFSNVAVAPSTETRNAGVNFGWMKQNLSAYYAESLGNMIVTGQGLTPVPVPGLSSNQIIPFSGKSYNAGYANTLIKHTSLSLSWSKFTSAGTGTGLFSNLSSEQYSGSLAYNYRKLNFIANFVHSEQGASVTTALPSNITIYYFGVSRWFDFF